jgi:hypothetical protein
MRVAAENTKLLVLTLLLKAPMTMGRPWRFGLLHQRVDALQKRRAAVGECSAVKKEMAFVVDGATATAQTRSLRLLFSVPLTTYSLLLLRLFPAPTGKSMSMPPDANNNSFTALLCPRDALCLSTA